MKIYIIRHGQTIKNKERLLQGRSDAPLNQQGIGQAQMAAQYFRQQHIWFDRVFSSPLQRSVQTARIVSGQSDIRLDDRLLEMDYGPYEGTSLDHPSQEIVDFFSDFVHNPAPKGMESLESVVRRMGSFLENLAKEPVEHVLVSTHAVAMKGALEYLDPYSQGSYWSRFISNCGIYRVDYEKNSFTLPQPLNV